MVDAKNHGIVLALLVFICSEKSTLVRETIDDLRKVAFEVVKTLGFLRWQNTIHADLKPENILLSYKGRLRDTFALMDEQLSIRLIVLFLVIPLIFRFDIFYQEGKSRR